MDKNANQIVRDTIDMRVTTMEKVICEKSDVKVGEGVTVCNWTDCHAGTVIKRTDNSITIQQDKATLLNGPNSNEPDKLVAHVGGFCAHFSGTQRWAYERDLNGVIYVARWSRKHKAFFTDKRRVIAGRHENYDYNF